MMILSVIKHYGKFYGIRKSVYSLILGNITVTVIVTVVIYIVRGRHLAGAPGSYPTYS